ncbi:hypothetical protein EDB89DRAFT_1996328 [Lactarius sanguifluus]|nr:hypothetical protein EDB89DRAFT_1996328 [Lactarius sanguifluus]
MAVDFAFAFVLFCCSGWSCSGPGRDTSRSRVLRDVPKNTCWRLFNCCSGSGIGLAVIVAGAVAVVVAAAGEAVGWETSTMRASLPCKNALPSGSPETMNTAHQRPAHRLSSSSLRTASSPPAPATFPDLCSLPLRDCTRRDGSHLGAPTNYAIRHHVRRRTSLHTSASNYNNCNEPDTQTLPWCDRMSTRGTISRYRERKTGDGIACPSTP